MAHLRVPEEVRANIEFRYYEAGHMMYVNEDELMNLRRNIVRFIAIATEVSSGQ